MASSSKDSTDDKSVILNNLISELETLENQSIHPTEDDPETKIDKLVGTNVMLKLKEFLDSENQVFEDKLDLLKGCRNLLVEKIENEQRSLKKLSNMPATGIEHDDRGENTKEGKHEADIKIH